MQRTLAEQQYNRIACDDFSKHHADVEVTRRLDHNFRWDGDGPNPSKEGFNPYDVTVTAMTIRNGRLFEGEAYLGGSYYRDTDRIGDIHGYLPQMIDEAVDEMDKALRQGVGVQE